VNRPLLHGADLIRHEDGNADRTIPPLETVPPSPPPMDVRQADHGNDSSMKLDTVSIIRKKPKVSNSLFMVSSQLVHLLLPDADNRYLVTTRILIINCGPSIFDEFLLIAQTGRRRFVVNVDHQLICSIRAIRNKNPLFKYASVLKLAVLPASLRRRAGFILPSYQDDLCFSASLFWHLQ